MRFLILILFVTSCTNYKKEYDKNLKLYKDLVVNINNSFKDSNLDSINISNFYMDDFVFHYYPVNHKKGKKVIKKEFLDSLNSMKSDGYMINIVHSIYLPGISEKSYDIDGSVRLYYGAEISIDTKMINFSGYQTINFKNGKIFEIWEWADYSGVKTKLKNLK